jgi:hypothetical protein
MRHDRARDLVARHLGKSGRQPHMPTQKSRCIEIQTDAHSQRCPFPRRSDVPDRWFDEIRKSVAGTLLDLAEPKLVQPFDGEAALHPQR